MPGTRLGLWSHFTSQFSANMFTMLWGFPFLISGQGLSPATASVLLSLMVVTAIVSSPVIGTLTVRYPFSRSTLVLVIVGAAIAAWTIVLLWPGRAPLWLLVVLVVLIAIGGPGSMIGFDLARTFNPPTRIGSASGIVNTGGFIATLTAVALVGVVLDRVAPAGPSTWDVDAFRLAMTVQYPVWALGIVQILRYRRKARRAALEADPEAYAAMQAGALRHLPLTRPPRQPRAASAPVERPRCVDSRGHVWLRSSLHAEEERWRRGPTWTSWPVACPARCGGRPRGVARLARRTAYVRAAALVDDDGRELVQVWTGEMDTEQALADRRDRSCGSTPSASASRCGRASTGSTGASWRSCSSSPTTSAAAAAGAATPTSTTSSAEPSKGHDSRRSLASRLRRGGHGMWPSRRLKGVGVRRRRR